MAFISKIIMAEDIPNSNNINNNNKIIMVETEDIIAIEEEEAIVVITEVEDKIVMILDPLLLLDMIIDLKCKKTVNLLDWNENDLGSPSM